MSEYLAICPACGEFIDYCQGHGMVGDPVGLRILVAHNNDDHSLCHVRAECAPYQGRGDA
jgi:hypothetical protein